MLGSMMANPFLAVQAAQAMHAGGWTGVNHDAMSAAAAQMAMYAQAQAAAAGRSGRPGNASAAAQATPPRAFAATRGRVHPFLGGGAVPGTQNGAAPHKPTASAFTALPAHLQMQLSGGLSMSQSGDAPPRGAPTTALASSASADALASVAPQTQAPGTAEGTATAANTGAAVRRPHRSGGARVWFLSPPRGLAARLRPTGRRCSR